MKKIIMLILSLACVMAFVGCSAKNETVEITEQPQTDVVIEEKNNYEKLGVDIYKCDDVYIEEGTQTHGSGTINLSIENDELEVRDYQILLCEDGCEVLDVVSRASQGYAAVYQVVADGEFDGNYKTYKFKMAIPEGMNEEDKQQMIEPPAGNYYYLLKADEKHYAYIHIARKADAEGIENEAEIVDTIVKNAEITLELEVAE